METVGILSLVLKASLFAQSILLILVVLLYLTIWFILRKVAVIRQYQKSCDAFDKQFWSGKDTDAIESAVLMSDNRQLGLTQLFLLAQDEFRKSHEKLHDSAQVTESVKRALEVAILHEEEFLDRHMQFLATVASVSPYIGLLGTVWGIITAFQALSSTSQATIALVAPGIAEALVATAMGLLAAIPALIAFNYFNRRNEIFSLRFEAFANRYLNLISRHI